MGPFETITAALTLADTIARIRLVKLQALSGEALTAEVVKQNEAEDQAIAKLHEFAMKVYDAADKVGGLFHKLHDAIHDDAQK